MRANGLFVISLLITLCSFQRTIPFESYHASGFDVKGRTRRNRVLALHTGLQTWFVGAIAPREFALRLN